LGRVEREIALRGLAGAGGGGDLALAGDVHPAGIFGPDLVVALGRGDDVAAGARLVAVAEPEQAADDHADRDKADDDGGDELGDRRAVAAVPVLLDGL